MSVGIQQVPWSRGIEANPQLLEQPLQFMLLKERPGSLHLFVATGTDLGVDGPASQNQCAHPWLLTEPESENPCGDAQHLRIRVRTR